MPLQTIALEIFTPATGLLGAALVALGVLHWRFRVRALELAEVSELALHLDTSRNARQLLCDAARTLSGADTVQLQEQDPDGRLVARATSGGGPLLGANAGGPGGGGEEGAAVALLAAASGSLVAEPVLDGHRALGLLVFMWQDDSRRGTRRDRRLSRLLAGHAATVLLRAEHEERLDRLAYLDALTGLPNRRALDDHLPREIARAERQNLPLTVAILDLDRFKSYNDQHGHPAGDRLLKRVAAGIAGSMRASDLAARYGGEEFALVMPSCTVESGTAAIDRMRDAMPAGQTFSAGVATWDGLETIDALLARADAALYEAKEAGRACTIAA